MAIRLHATVSGFLGVGATAPKPWSVNLMYGATVALSSGDLATAAEAARTAIAASSTAKLGLNTTTNITQIRLAMHSPDTGPETSVGVSTGAAVAGTATVTLPAPPQVAVVLTLRTGVPGRSFRGRLYWPGQAAGINSDGRFTQQSVINASVQAVNDAIETAVASAGSALAWYVWSKVHGAGTPITGVSIGNTVDTQRRRVEALETYTNFPVT